MEIIAHRGASALEPENTIRSIKKAIELGSDRVEVDVRRTYDGTLVIHHDPTLDRTTNGNGFLNQFTYQKLLNFDAGKDEKIPTLFDVLKLVKNKIGLVIEIKEPGTELDVLWLVKDQDMMGEVIIASFFHPVLLNLKYLEPNIKTGIIFVGRPVNTVIMAKDARADVVFIKKDFIDVEMVRECHFNNIKIFPWVIDDLKEFQLMEDLLVDGVISNTLLTLL